MPTKRLFNDISLGISTGNRIGIVGENGDGKSTLLKLLDGQITPDEGRVVRTNGVTIGMLSQTDDLDDDATVIEAIIGDIPEHEWASDPKIRSVLEGLVFDIDSNAKVGMLSGGQRRRVDLARVLVGNWDIVMLDEPTNHLDMRTIAWLANHLKTRWKAGSGALLVVSHDRWFLDETCNLMWEVHDGSVDRFEGGFSAYIMQRVERQRIAAVTESRRQNRLRRELAWLSRGARARATKPKFHVAAAQELIADVPELRNAPQLKRVAAARIGKDVVELKGVTVSFKERDHLAETDALADQDRSSEVQTGIVEDAPTSENVVLDDIDWSVGPGDRIGILGDNGAGKTTLLNVVRGALDPTCGHVKIGMTVKFAMLSQRLEKLSEVEDQRIREFIARYPRRKLADGTEVSPSMLLEDLGFSRSDLNEYIRDLSGGQKRRLALMMVLLEEANVLILDEPGNDLDIDMLAALEDLLDEWPATLIVVTHDRNLMDRVTDDQYALIDGKLRHLPGGIDQYIELANAQAAKNAAHEGSEPNSLEDGVTTDDQLTEDDQIRPALSNKERQRLKKLVASLDRKMETLQTKIANARMQLEEIDPSDYQALLDAQYSIAELEDQLEALELEWLESSEILAE